MDYLLDTNIVVIYLRDNEQARHIEATLQLLRNDVDLLLSVVSLGELKSIAQRNNWGKRKMARMLDLLDDFAIIDINIEEIIDRYAAIDTYSQGKLEHRPTKFSARNMGKNDLWIAATASIYNVELITTDKDFDHLKDEYIKLNRINLDDYKNE